MIENPCMKLPRYAGLDKAEQFTPELLWLVLEFGAEAGCEVGG